jgi:hypothetical protein
MLSLFGRVLLRKRRPRGRRLEEREARGHERKECEAKSNMAELCIASRGYSHGATYPP